MAVNVIAGMDWYQVVTVPRLDDVPDPRRWMAASVTAAIIGMHARLLAAGTGEPAAMFAAAWLRPHAAEQPQFLIGGRPDLPVARPAATVNQQSPILFPPGARGVHQPAGRVDDRLNALSWLCCLDLADVEATQELDENVRSAVDTNIAPAGLDDYVIHLSQPFGWLIIAQPVGRGVLSDQRGKANQDAIRLRPRENSEIDQIDHRRAQRRVQELTRAQSRGLWEIRVLAGGHDTATAHEAAALLCSSADLDATGHRLVPATETATLAAALQTSHVTPDGARTPFHAGSDLLAALTRPPVREIPGLHVTTPYSFDVTPVRPIGLDRTVPHVYIGEVLDQSLSPAGEFTVSHDTINRHVFICGATGSGKSQTTRHLLEALARQDPPVPWLAIEPVKAEYAAMATRLNEPGQVLRIRPGDRDAQPASLNPLEPEPGFSLQSHADLVRALFLAAFEAEEPFPQVLSAALTECYTSAGWDLATGELRPEHKPKFYQDDPPQQRRPRYPTLRELQTEARRFVQRIGYGREITANVTGFVDVRIGSLRLGTPGRFFEGGHPLDIKTLLQRNVVLELESLTSDQDKAFLIGVVIIRVVEYLRVHRKDAAGLQHVLLIEEAHRLLKKIDHGPAAAAVDLFTSMLAEIRAYGEGVIVVEQIPAKIVPDVIKNTALKVMHRLPALDDRDTVGATMNLTLQQSEAVVSLTPGIAAASVDGDDRPLLLHVPGGMLREDARQAEELVETKPPLLGRRSQLCGTTCRARACIFDEIADAADTAVSPLLVVYTEAVAISLTTGRRPPSPTPEVLRSWPAGERLRACTLATLADRATDARRPHLQRWVDPDDFAAALRSLLAASLTGDDPPDFERRHYQAGPSRWVDIKRTLLAHIKSQQGPGTPRMATSEDLHRWERRGLYLDASTSAGQLRQLQEDIGYGKGHDIVHLGDPDASGLIEAVRRAVGEVTELSLKRVLRATCGASNTDALRARMKRIIL